jgi:hypothetical protein
MPASSPKDSGGDLTEPTQEELVRYVDGEMSGAEREAFEGRLAKSTELQREVAIQSTMRGELRAMGLERPIPPGGSIWESVNKQIARPTAWIFLVAGVLLYIGYAVYTFVRSPMDIFERLMIGLVVIGFVMLLASVAYERIRDYRTDPYKGVER